MGGNAKLFGSMCGGGLIMRQIESKSRVSCSNGFLYNWPGRQLQMSQKNGEAEIVSQGTPAAVRLARDSWGVTA